MRKEERENEAEARKDSRQREKEDVYSKGGRWEWILKGIREAT